MGVSVVPVPHCQRADQPLLSGESSRKELSFFLKPSKNPFRFNLMKVSFYLVEIHTLMKLTFKRSFFSILK